MVLLRKVVRITDEWIEQSFIHPITKSRYGAFDNWEFIFTDEYDQEDLKDQIMMNGIQYVDENKDKVKVNEEDIIIDLLNMNHSIALNNECHGQWSYSYYIKDRRNGKRLTNYFLNNVIHDKSRFLDVLHGEIVHPGIKEYYNHGEKIKNMFSLCGYVGDVIFYKDEKAFKIYNLSTAGIVISQTFFKDNIKVKLLLSDEKEQPFKVQYEIKNSYRWERGNLMTKIDELGDKWIIYYPYSDPFTINKSDVIIGQPYIF